MSRPTAALATALLLPLAACGRVPTAPASPLRVTAAASAFNRGPSGGARVPFTVANAGPEPVGVVQCGPALNPVLERAAGGRWATYAGGLCPAIYASVPVPLAPGASRADTVGVGEAGRYRIVVVLDGGMAASAAFEVR